VHYATVDVDRFSDGADGTPWSALIMAHLAACTGQDALPILFVDGQPVGGIKEVRSLAESGELKGFCVEAGADLLEAPPASRLPWTPQTDARWRPPKDINGRRWFQDDPNSAAFPDEHNDAARIEFNVDSVSPGAGTDHRGRFTGAAKALLRQATRLDESAARYKPFTDVDLLLKPDLGWAYYLRSRDLERARGVTREDEEREDLTRGQLAWVYSQGKKKLVEELELRQCHHKVVSCIDVQSLREALMDEMRKERAFSPTQLGVVPGVVQSLSGPQLKVERFAGTDTPLLLAVLSERSPPCFRFRDQLHSAARRLLRAIRIVRVDGHLYPEVAREFGVVRYPTLVWLQGGTGAELARQSGVLSALALCDQTAALLQRARLPAPAEGVGPALPVLELPRWRVDEGHRGPGAPRWASTRTLRNTGAVPGR